ncbi:MAG TPA: hypothetical protein VH062_26740 [Polyangiaceae bacterium]|jgi:hypothetical protein|nr:hypothetical protein [Polyangiaceae bacterium]
MNQRLLCGVILFAVGCSSGTDGNGAGDGAAGGGSLGGAGNGGGAGQQGTGATPSTGNTPGSGATGNGGASVGNGGSTTGNGGSSVGNGGATTGNGGATSSGGSAGASGGNGGGTAGASGSGGMGTGGAPDTSQSVLERNKHANRDGYFIQPTLTAAAAAKLTKDTGFAPKLNGSMWASPLYLEQGPGGKGVFYAVTTTNDVYALDETTGAVVWTKNLGPSPLANGPNAPCGSIHPLGIISTPVIDATSRTLYVAGAIGTGITDPKMASSDMIVRHEVHAFSVDDGSEKPGFPITVGGTSGSTTFSPQPQNQRSALSLVNGTLYVAYGGHVGDCGTYHGWVIGIDTADPTKHGGWATLGLGEGIWAPGGLASDGNGVFAVTGNNRGGAAADHMNADSEEVVRITGLGVLDRTAKNMFFPSTWKTMDSGDQDFGSVSPVYVSVPGSTPANVVAAASKDGHLYLLDPANLGGMTPAVDFVVATGSNSIHGSLSSYTTAKGRYIVFSTDGNAKCPAGGPTGKVVESVLVAPGSPPKPSVAWCAALSSAPPGPIITSTDGTANPIVWYMNGTTLTGVDGDTGKAVYTGSGANTCANQEQWTSLIATKGRIVSGANGSMCSWSSK